MINLKDKFYKNIQHVFLLNICNRVISSVNLFILSLFFSADDYGKFVWVITVVSYFAILCDLGIETYAQREIAEKSNEKIGNIFYTRLIISVFSLLACLTYLMIANSDLLLSNLFYLIPVYLLFFSIQFSWYFAGQQEFKLALIGTFLQNIISLIIIVCSLLLNNYSLVSLSL